MPHPNDGPSPYQKYSSIDDSEQPPRSSRSSNTIHPGTVGEHPCPPQQNKENVRNSAAGRVLSRTFAVVMAMCGLTLLAGSGVSWIQSSSSRNTGAAAVGFLEVRAYTGISGAETRRTEPSSVDIGNDVHDLATLEFTALNFYHVRDGKPGQDYPWLNDVKLIEPHRDTTLAVVGPREGFSYRWEVRAGGSSSSDGAGEVQAMATGAVTIVVLTQLDENVVVLEEVNGDGQVTNRLEETVLVKYVRREIRTLTDDEKGELLDAMYQIWAVRVDGGIGKELYGEDYADIAALHRLHFKAAANGTCDHIHEGMNFLVSHSLLTNTFEFSLQRVNPKLTVPYWDFTIETTAASKVAYDPNHPLTRTELLSPSWFGTVDFDDYVLKDGRWAYTEIPSVKDGDPGLLEPDVYNRMRAPWNVNDRPYLTRGLGKMCQSISDKFLPWPTCKIHYDLVTSNFDLYSWVWSSMGDAHGPVHNWLGGEIDCDATYNEIGNLVGADVAEVLAYLGSGYRQGLFCDGIWRCTKIASVDEKPSELFSSGTCGCQGYDLTQGGDYKIVMAELSYAELILGNHSEDVQRRVVELICSGNYVDGDIDLGNGALDPMFWPVHPTLERLYQYSVLTGTLTDFRWADEDVTITRPDGTSYTKYLSSYYEECNGHHGSHIFPYGLLGSDIDGFKVKTGIRGYPAAGNNLTNREVLATFDPRSNSLNHVYDTFKWDHCMSQGYDFDDAWGEPKPSPRKKFYERDEPLSPAYASFKRMMADLMEKEGE